MEFLDYYSILGVSFGATQAQIRRAYKILVGRLHPDLFPNDPEGQAWANENLKQINLAYGVLRDPTSRAEYDRNYSESRSKREQGPGPRPEQQRVQCPLCNGTGRVTCLTCGGRGSTSCPGCQGAHIVVCPLCFGAGTLTQADYERHRAEAERAERQSRAREEARRQQAEQEAQRRAADAARQEAEETSRRAEEAKRQVDGRRRVAVISVSVVLGLLIRALIGAGFPQVEQTPPQPQAVQQPDIARSSSTLSAPSKQNVSSPSAQTAAVTDLRSIHGRTPTTVKFVNRLSQSVRILWVDYQGREVFYKHLGSGESYTQHTYATHPWRVRIASSGQLIRTIVPGETPITVVLTAPTGTTRKLSTPVGNSPDRRLKIPHPG